ncbi:glycosyltransferase [Gramella sp. GC03-9]|uniref:Glycosyltransferase n=1 Tax=Christiangramia oceanisediminis TaxID=2920386 RepID=A0A9X2I386_9FLAO|nr:glycosyltransferase [Gramella oceanisediminis]MCP9199895.1 glycosyltransferase [Gramella oceanisediminis]
MISIVTATYNSAHTITKAIDSIVKQSYKKWELIIVDDGSSDDTEKIIKGYDDTRIKYFYQKNKGVAAARNVGVKESLGDYIIFLDADDELFNTAIENFSNVLETKTPGICSGAYIDIFNKLNYPRDKGSYFNNYLINNLSGSYIVSKQIFLEVGGYDINLSQSENWELFIRLVDICDKKGMEILAENFVTFKYNSDHSIEKNLKRNIDTFNSYKYLYNKYKDNSDLGPNLLFLFSEVSAYNAFKIGKKKEAIEWQIKAIKEKPFKLKSYIKILRFIVDKNNLNDG